MEGILNMIHSCFGRYNCFNTGCWQLIFLIYGAITIAVGFICLVVLPDNHDKAMFLSKGEREQAKLRVADNKTGRDTRKVSLMPRVNFSLKLILPNMVEMEVISGPWGPQRWKVLVRRGFCLISVRYKCWSYECESTLIMMLSLYNWN